MTAMTTPTVNDTNTITGPKVVHVEPDPFLLKDGDKLICEYTDPQTQQKRETVRVIRYNKTMVFPFLRAEASSKCGFRMSENDRVLIGGRVLHFSSIMRNSGLI